MSVASESRGESLSDQDVIRSLRRKLNAVEKEKLDLVIANNEEIGRLTGETTRLRMLVERGEAAREAVEYQLTVADRELNMYKDQLTEARQLSSSEQQILRKKIEEQTEEIRRWKEEFESNLHEKRLHADELNNVISEKDEVMSKMSSDLNLVHEQYSNLKASSAKKKELIESMEAAIRELKESNELMAKESSSLRQEVECLRDKDGRQSKELYQALDRIREIEESFERERALHLESKFTSDIVDLRIKDLENALKKEKEAKKDVLQKLEVVAEHTKEIQNSCEVERQNYATTQEKLNRAENELLVVNHRFDTLSAEKKNKIQSLSDQIEKQQKECDRLQAELFSTRKKQIAQQEAYCMAFSDIKSLLPMKDTETVIAYRDAASVKNFSALVQVLRDAMNTEKQQKEKISAEVFKLRTQNRKQAATLKDLKRKLTQRTRNLKDADRKVSEAEQQWRIKYEKEQEECSHLREERENLQNHVTIDKSTLQQLRNQVEKLSANRQADKKTFITFLSLLHQQLLLILQGSKSDMPLAPTHEDNDDESWNDLALVVNEEVSSVISQLRILREKSSHKDIVDSQQKTQALNTNSGHLVAESSLLRSQLKQSRGECGSLLAACALLIGFIREQGRSVQHQAHQLRVLQTQLERFDLLKLRLAELVSAMSFDDTGGPVGVEETRPESRMRHGILRFRVAVVCVLAVKRLQRLERMRECVWKPCSLKEFKSDNQLKQNSEQNCIDQMFDWLTSRPLKSLLLSTTSDLKVIISGGHKKDNTKENKRGSLFLINQCRTHLFHQISQFTALTGSNRRDCDKNSLMSRLSTGLKIYLQHVSESQRLFHTNSEEIARCLELRILEFTRRLHRAELEKNQLFEELQSLESSNVHNSNQNSEIQGAGVKGVEESYRSVSLLKRKLSDAENALRTAARDRETLENYAICACMLLKKSCPSIVIGSSVDTVWSTAALHQYNSQHIKISTSLQSVRALIDQFVDCVDLLLVELRERRSNKDQLTLSMAELKEELAAVYQTQLIALNQELEQEENRETRPTQKQIMMTSNQVSGTSENSKIQRIDFRPLVDNLNESLCKIEDKLSAASSSHGSAVYRQPSALTSAKSRNSAALAQKQRRTAVLHATCVKSSATKKTSAVK